METLGAIGAGQEFILLSPLGVSVMMFLAVGVLLLVIGLVWPFFLRGNMTSTLAVTPRTDEIYFGGSIPTLIEAAPALAKLRDLLMAWVSACLVAQGSLAAAVAWFALRRGEAWSLVVLVAATVGAGALWVWSLLPYRKAGVRFKLSDIPPFIWVPAALVVPAAIFGWIGIEAMGRP